ncbi:MAG: APC family permease [Alphaproteobacteria bacterium]
MTQQVATPASQPTQSLSQFDAIAMIVGIVVGIGIFTFPALVAMNAASERDVLLLWAGGGLISLIGALCYAELSSAYPSAGGEYHFITRAFGRDVGLIFAWARLGVIQTGAIALVCFILGDYATQLYSLGTYSSAIYAALTVIVLTSANLLGAKPGKTLQNLLSSGIIIILVAAILGGLINGLPPASAPAAPAAGSAAPATAIGAAMIFILLTYGGWNEAAYLSAEVKNPARNMVRVMVVSLLLITLLYVLVNVSYLRVLGLDGMRQGTTIGAELMRREFGAAGALVLSLAVILAALSTANATIFTGARTNYALGQNFAPLAALGAWDPKHDTPRAALLVQGAISLALVVVGAITLDGVKAMVNYVTPVFWFFMLLVALSVFVLRVRDPQTPRPFRVPLYPVTPAVFVLTCGYMLHSGIDFARMTYAGLPSLLGLGIVLLGVPLLVWGRLRAKA